jgi:hypothetical protein
MIQTESGMLIITIEMLCKPVFLQALIMLRHDFKVCKCNPKPAHFKKRFWAARFNPGGRSKAKRSFRRLHRLNEQCSNKHHPAAGSYWKLNIENWLLNIL